MMHCMHCGKETKGTEITPGAISAVCGRCYTGPSIPPPTIIEMRPPKRKVKKGGKPPAEVA